MTLKQILAKYELYRQKTSTSPARLPSISPEEREIIKDVHNKIKGK